MVLFDNDGSCPRLANSSRNMTVFSKRVATVLCGCEVVLATPNGMFCIEKCFAYILLSHWKVVKWPYVFMQLFSRLRRICLVKKRS